MSFLTGGSKSTSESKNLAFPWIQENFGGWAQPAGQSVNALGNILGMGGSGAHDQAMDDYWGSSGGKFLMDQGLDGLTSRFASMGLSRSGSAMKAMEGYRQDLASTKLDNYLSRLSEMARLGLGAGGLVANAGQVSKGTSKSGGGLGGLIGAGLSLASDERIKHNIEKVDEFADGLGVYDFDYRRDLDPSLPGGRQRGVMAQEVANLRPWALGPVRADGMMTVDYEKLA